MFNLKNTTVFKTIRRYRFFIAGLLLVPLAYGVISLIKNGLSESELILPSVPKIDFERFVLANGLEIIVHIDRAAPLVSLTTSYQAGSRYEPRGKTGLAHLTEHLLLESTTRQGLALRSELERIGGWDYNGVTDRDCTRLYMTVPKQSFDAALWLEAERMDGAADRVSIESLDKARQIVLNELRRNQSGNGAVFEAAITDAMFPPEHPYSHLPGGSPEDLASISLEDIKGWVKEHYRPDNATLVITGDLDFSAIRDRIENYFDSIPGGSRRQFSSSWIMKQETLRHYRVSTLPPGAYVLVWSLPGYGSPDLDRLDMARHILEARLINRLVLETRTARSVRINLKPYQLCSLFVLMIEAREGNPGSDILSDVERELTIIMKDGAGRSEVGDAKRAILASLLFASERSSGPDSKAEILASGATVAGNPAEFNATIDRILHASPEEITHAISTWLSFESATLITPGAKSENDGAIVSNRPQSMPPFDNSNDSNGITIERMMLTNRLTALVSKRTSPVGAAKLIWRKEASTPLREDILRKAVLNLLSEGSSKSLASTLPQLFTRLSAKLVIDDTADYYAVGLDLPAQNLDQGIEALFNMIANATFDESRVAAVRRRIEKRMTNSEPAAGKTFLAAVMRLLSTGQLDEAMGADCSTLASFTVTDIQKAYETFFRPDKATLILAGDPALTRLDESGLRIFNSWRARDQQSGASVALPLEMKEEPPPVYILDRPGTDFAVVFTGAILPPADSLNDPGSDILANILDARMARRLREETQTSYETFAGRWGWGEGQIIFAYADTRSDRVPSALRFVEETYKSLGNADGFCEGDFKQARTESTREELRARESTQSLMNLLVESVIGTAAQPQAEAVMCAKVLDTGRYLAEQRGIIRLIMGDGNSIAKSLNQLGYKTRIIQSPCWSSIY